MWNNCFIKYQTLDFVYAEVLNVNPCKQDDCILLLTVSKAEFRGQFPYLDKLQDIRIYTVIREPVRLPEIQYPASVWYLLISITPPLLTSHITFNFLKHILHYRRQTYARAEMASFVDD